MNPQQMRLDMRPADTSSATGKESALLERRHRFGVLNILLFPALLCPC